MKRLLEHTEGKTINDITLSGLLCGSINLGIAEKNMLANPVVRRAMGKM